MHRRYLFVVLLAGCTASNWTKEGGTKADLDSDWEECRVTAKPDPALPAIAGAFGVIGVFVGTQMNDSRIRECLQAHGWTVGPNSTEATASAAAPAATAAPAAAPVKTAQPETPAARRLTELKQLLDQGLITTEEYEERRRAVLGGL